MIAWLWEASFTIANARKAAPKLDVAYVTGCLFRAAGVTAHALHGHGRRWLVNEKGTIASAGLLPVAPSHFADRVAQSFTGLSGTESSLVETCELLQAVVDETQAALTP